MGGKEVENLFLTSFESTRTQHRLRTWRDSKLLSHLDQQFSLPLVIRITRDSFNSRGVLNTTLMSRSHPRPIRSVSLEGRAQGCVC